jgi:preprotein translocase subunit SecA
VIRLSQSVNVSNLDPEKVVVGLMEIVPFDETGRTALKEQIKKGKSQEEVSEFLRKVVMDVYERRKKELGERVFPQVEKFAYLSSIDHMWIEHLDSIDAFEDAVKLRGYAQKDPLSEFKNEAFGMFEGLLSKINSEVARRLFRIGVAQAPQPVIPVAQARTNIDQIDQTGLAQYGEDTTAKRGARAFAQAPVENSASSSGKSSTVSRGLKLGRNDPCWCGSGKKWKKCHYPQLG